VSLILGINTMRSPNRARTDAREFERSSLLFFLSGLQMKFGFAMVAMGLAFFCTQAQVASGQAIRAGESSTPTLASLPAAARAAISSALGREGDSYKVSMRDGYLQAENARQQLRAEFQASGVQVRSGSAHWGMALAGYGYGEAVQKLQSAQPEAKQNRVEYRRGAVTEWYVNGPLGLEQGFTLAAAPGAKRQGPVTIALALSGDLQAVVDGNRSGLKLSDRQQREALRYGGLSAYDASGKALRSWMELRGKELRLRVDDAGAVYPVVVDPWVQLARLYASDGAVGDKLGQSIAISGNTVVVGAFSAAVGNNSSQGAAYVFVKPANGWQTQTTESAKLTASNGAPGDQFGSSVSISGNTIVVGAPYAGVGVNPNQGTAYVFVMPSGGWSGSLHENAQLTASDGIGGDELGYSVAISGNTVVAGASDASIGTGCPNGPSCKDFEGAAYVYVQPSGGWNGSQTETAKLTASDGTSDDGFAQAVSISGNTIVVGSRYFGMNTTYAQGAAYVYVQPANGWTSMTQTAELTTSDGKAAANFGASVGISGTTIVVGAMGAQIGKIYQQGGAYVYVMPSGGWTTTSNPTGKLTASDGATGDQFGTSVSIDGDTIVVGAPNAAVASNKDEGAAYIFSKPAGGWTNMTQSAKLSSSGGRAGDSYGTSCSISGASAAIGAPRAPVAGSFAQGVAYVNGD
jgi:FG-GAP repeat